MLWATAEAREIAIAAGTRCPEQAIRQLAAQATRNARVVTVPVGWADLFAELHVRRVRFREMVLEGGLLRNEDGGFNIEVRCDASEPRQRFSIAHELGHILFYKFAPRAKRQQVVNKVRAPHEEERLCNVAADELLMLEWYMKCLANDALAQVFPRLANISRECRVSLRAACIRYSQFLKLKGAIH